MTVLQMFWISSIGGAVLFFIGGYLIARVRRDGAAALQPPQQLDWQPPATNPPIDRELQERATAAEQRVLEQLEIAQSTELAFTEERAAAQETIAGHHAQLSEGRSREAALEKKVDELEVIRLEHARLAAQANESESIRREVARLQNDLGAANRQLAQRTDRSREAKLEKRVNELEVIRLEHARLRTRVDESDSLRREVAKLTTALSAAKRAQQKPVIKAPRVVATPSTHPVPRVPAAEPSATGEPSSVAEALAQSIQPLLDESTSAVVVADQVGFPVTAVGEDAVSLAAYSTLLAEAGERAGSFFAFAAPRQLLLRDCEETYVSLWPFEIDGERLALLTLSNKPPDESRAELAIDQVAKLLTRSRAPLSIAN